ncbi:tetratricopeptide repeat protein [Thiocapsa sp.]|uniref:tetratricopeptide repeat protein n=1 Tax=Thiocapsa sp. TaxID=2024551 RepID=UPI0025F66EF4|nr:tetratricopeptide repeat protein [Thiocapsa sp.]
MTRKDALGLPMSGADATAADLYHQALHAFQCYRGDPVAITEQASSRSPEFVMARVLHAYLHLLGTEPDGFAVARADLEAAGTLPSAARERAHLTAVQHLVDSEWHVASRILEDIAIDYPNDILALQVGHVVDFYTGASRLLRDRIARALPSWSADMPGYHAIIGMHAFGLEETGLYARAEAAGRRAVELERRDAWAWHAVAHVMEMQGRTTEGIAWLRSDSDAWSVDNFFAVHNWWHLALYHLELDEVDEVLRLFDGPIYGQRSRVVLDMIDASALLWRLKLRGIPLGERWQAVADGWEPIADAGNYAFNDAHAMMAFTAAQRRGAAERVFAAQAHAVDGSDDKRFFVREVGSPVTRAIHAFGEGDFAETVRLLRPVRDRANRFGGSHAQRDLLDLTLIEAAVRDGQLALARALIAERIDLKPDSASARVLLARAAEPRVRQVA